MPKNRIEIRQKEEQYRGSARQGRVHHRGEQGNWPGDGPRARTSWESPSSSAAETRQTVGPPPKSFAPKASRRSSPSGSTSRGPRIIKRSPGISRGVTASSTSW